jgi:hypothetical protein
MAVPFQHRRAGSATRLTVLLLAGEAFFDTDVSGWFVGDGTTLGGVQVANSHVTAVTGATQTIADTDVGRFFSYTNAGGCAVTLPQAGSAGPTFPASTGFWVVNNGGGNVVITPTTSTINGAANLTLGVGDSCVVVSDGSNYFALVGRVSFSAGIPVAAHVVGNTTAVSSTSTLSLTNQTISMTGGISAGFSLGSLIISGATLPANQSMTATGNTTAGTSSTTRALTAFAISATGNVSAGWSGSTLVISAAAGGASGTALSEFVIGNTTAATSSSVLTLTQMTVSGAGGVSVGFSTTGAGAGVLIISGATGVASATSMGQTALGSTTGLTSSQTAALTAEAISGAGIVSVGFSAGTIVVSATAAGAGQISYFEPRALQGTNSLAVPMGTFNIIPMEPWSALTINQVKMLVTKSIGANASLVVATTTTSDVLTASAQHGYTQSFVHYTQVDATTFSSSTSTTAYWGVQNSWSISRSSNSNTVSLTQSYFFHVGSVTSSLSSSITASSAAAATHALGVTGSTGFTSLFETQYPWATTFASGLAAIGYGYSSSTSAASQSTGASVANITSGLWNQSVYFGAAIGNVAIRTNPGGAVVGIVPYGAGITSSVGSVAPASFTVPLSSTTAGYSYLWAELGVF